MKEQGSNTTKGNVGTTYKKNVSLRSDKVSVPKTPAGEYKNPKKA